MKEDRFIREHHETWKSFEDTLAKLKSKGFQKFKSGELDSFIASYNRICGHLSHCRTYYGSTTTTEYLNRLVATAHSFIYATQSSNLKKFLYFFIKEFPLLIKGNLKYLLVSTLIFIAGMAVSFIYTAISPDNAVAFLPREYADSIDFSGNTSKFWDGAIMSSFILTNNIKVGFIAFALGVTLGVGTIWVLISNGFMLGGLGALAYHSGFNLRFWSLILPHGILELFAIFVCGAAGLMIGYSIIHPGDYSRKDSFIIGSKAGIKLIGGTVPIFVIAGLIEGFFTPLAVSEASKILFAILTLGLLLFYLIFFNFKFKGTVD